MLEYLLFSVNIIYFFPVLPRLHLRVDIPNKTVKGLTLKPKLL
jgi:hypothetical protein